MLKRSTGTLGLLSLLVVSTLLHWLAARRLHGLWILPDEAVYATRAIAFWRHGVIPPLHGEGAGYGLLYPLVAGVPFSVGSIAHGYASLKLLQALVVSLAAVPVFAYARRLMPRGYAFVAAALTVASPLLLYSGLVMTEVLFYPLAAVALLAIARAVATATLRDQAIAFAAILAAVLTRTQAVAFVAVLGCAILLDAAFTRRRDRLRAFWPTWLLFGVAAAVVPLVPSVVGSYADTLRGSYPLGEALRLSFDHLSYVALATGLAPATALILLVARAFRGEEQDTEARALIAVTVSAVAVLVVQVGFFAARFAPHLLGRDLAALPPLLFLVFALWLARGAPRPLVPSVVAAFAVLALVLLAPWNTLVTPTAFADSLDLLLVSRLHWHPVDIVMTFGLAMLAAFVVVPRRARIVLPAVVFAILVSASIIASNQLTQVDNAAQMVLGPDKSWIDHAADSDVAYLFHGEHFWNVVWQERFWNPRIDHVYSIRPTAVPGPMPQTSVRVRSSGSVPLSEKYVVATDTFTFVGEPIAHLAQQGLDVSGLTLWRLDGAPRVSTAISGVRPNGDMSSPATITAYDCAGGRLELTLLPKLTKELRISLDGKLVLQANVAGLAIWNGTIPVPASRRTKECTFTIVPDQLLGSTRIAFVRG